MHRAARADAAQDGQGRPRKGRKEKQKQRELLQEEAFNVVFAWWCQFLSIQFAALAYNPFAPLKQYVMQEVILSICPLETLNYFCYTLKNVLWTVFHVVKSTLLERPPLPQQEGAEVDDGQGRRRDADADRHRMGQHADGETQSIITSVQYEFGINDAIY